MTREELEQVVMQHHPNLVRFAASELRRRNVGSDDPSLLCLTKAASNQKSDKPIGISVGAILNADGVFRGDPFQTGLTLEPISQLLTA